MCLTVGSEYYHLPCRSVTYIVPVAYQVILEPGVTGQFRQFRSPRVRTREKWLELLSMSKMNRGMRESVS